MNISFGWTSSLLPPHGPKCVTRRTWSDSYFLMALGQWERYPDKAHKAVDKGLHRGGKVIGTLRFTQAPYREALGAMPESDLVLEGGACATLEEFRAKYFPKLDLSTEVVVIRFEFTPTAEFAARQVGAAS